MSVQERGPWDDFKPQATADEDGPWSAYQTPAAPPPEQDGAWTRGSTQAKASAAITSGLATGDTAGVARRIAELDAYRRANPGTPEGNELMAAWEKGDGITGGIKEVAGEFAKDWRDAPGLIGSLRATGKNLSAMGGGIVEQVPNMVAPMGLMLAGGAAGLATPVPGGALVGGFAGATAGNTLMEGGEQVNRALQKAGINPQDTQAVQAFLAENGDKILGQAAVKGGIIGAVDTATMRLGHGILSGPANAAADRALAAMGVNLADKAAVKAARELPEFAARVASDATLQAQKSGANALARNATVAGLEPAGEFVGEYFGQGVATGDYDSKGAFLEAASSLGQSAATFAGQKAYQAVTSPVRGPLSRAAATAQETGAAGLAQAAAGEGMAQNEAAADPFAARLAGVASFAEDKAFLRALRQDGRFGAESVTELLGAYAAARNPQTDPTVREKALADIEQFTAAFVGPNTMGGQQNFTMPQVEPDAFVRDPQTGMVPFGQGTDVAQAGNPSPFDPNTLDGEAREVGTLPRQILTGPEEVAQQYRRDLLEQVLSDPDTRNPLSRYESVLKKNGFEQRRATPEERKLIEDRSTNAVQAPSLPSFAAVDRAIMESGITPDNSRRPAFPLSREGAERQAAKRQQETGEAFAVVPHPTVKGRFAVEAAQSPQVAPQAEAQSPQADQFRDATKMVEPTNSLSRTASWVIRDKATGEAVMETFDRKKVDALNTEKYEAVPIQEHLASLNQPQGTPNETPAKAIEATPQRGTAQQAETAAEQVRAATPREAAVADRAEPVLDLNKRPTGWKQVEYPNGDGVLLISADGKKAITFPSRNAKSGTEALRAQAKAQAFAIDNPHASDVPRGELVVKPIFDKAQQAEVTNAPTPRTEGSQAPAVGEPVRAAVDADLAQPAPVQSGAAAQGADVQAAGAVDRKIAEAERAGVALSPADKSTIQRLQQEADDLTRKANRLGISDPMNKGNAFPMGVGFTKMTKRKSQAIDSSVRRAGDAVKLYNAAKVKQAQVERMLSGVDTDAHRATQQGKKEQSQRELVARLVNWKKGDKIGKFTIERVSNDKDGYPTSYTISGDGIIKGVMDKTDIARDFFGGDKDKLRRVVDEVRNANAAQSTQAQQEAGQASRPQGTPQGGAAQPGQGVTPESRLERAKQALDREDNIYTALSAMSGEDFLTPADDVIAVIKRATDGMTPEAKRGVNALLRETTRKHKDGKTYLSDPRKLFDLLPEQFAGVNSMLRDALNETLAAGKGAEDAKGGFVTTRTVYGDTVRVRRADLDGDRALIPMFTADGKPKFKSVHRENLDPDGSKQAAQNAEAGSLDDVVTAKNGTAFASKLAARREQNRRGFAESHDIVPGDEVQAGLGGFVLKRKAAQQPRSDLDTVAERVTEPTHADPGQKPEAATAPVIREAIQKSARNTPFDAKQAKAWLLAEIDKAIANVPPANRDMAADLAQEKARKFKLSDRVAKLAKGSIRDKLEREEGAAFDAMQADRIAKTARQIGFVTFDVPGDGKFKVVNTVEAIEAFRDKVESSPGFRTNPTRGMSYGTGNAQGPSLDETLKKLGNTPDALQEIGNAIEIARLKKAKDEDKLLDRFREASGGKDYDAWRAEQEAEGEIAAREDGQSEQADSAATPATQAKQADKAPDIATPPGSETASPVGEEAGREGKSVISDAGEKIGGARKDRWKDRGMDIADLDEMTEAEGAELVTKANVWKPNYEAISERAEPVTAAMVKIVYDGLAAKPKDNTPEGRRRFVKAMQAVRKVYDNLDGPDAVKNAYHDLRRELGVPDRGGIHFNENEQAARAVLFSVYKGRSDPFVFMYQDLQRAKKMVEQGFPSIDPWKKRLLLRKDGGAGLTDRGVEMHIEGSAALGTPLNAEQLRAGFYRVITNDSKTVAYAATKEDAEAAARTIYERDMKGKSKDGKEEPSRPHLDSLIRKGMPNRIDRDVTPEDFIETLGFRGIEFGNWSAQDERQRIINMAYDGLLDLAEIMGVPPKALSLNGSMGLAFGARGGGKFLAHYEPGKLVINMTKLRGGGSLAHEWAHALDHYFGELDRSDAYTTQARGASGWMNVDDYSGQARTRHEKVDGKWVAVSKRRLENLRPEMAEAFDNVMRAIFKKQTGKAEMVRSVELQIEKAKTDLAGEQRDNYRGYLGRHIKSLEQHLAELRNEPDNKTYPQGASDYSTEAGKLSGKSKNGYWSRPTEMFARAFESWVFDRVTAMGARSDYLVHGVEDGRFAGGEYKGNPYPSGKERADINAAFEKLASTMKTRETDKGTALFSRDTAQSGTTPDAIWNAIESLVGPIRKRRVIVVQSADVLVDQGVLKSTDAQGVQAFVKDGKAYFIADAIQPGNERAVFLHEVGAHLGMERILSPLQRSVLLNRIKTWAAQDNGSQESRIAQAALRRVEAAGVTGQDADAELIAYTVEEAVKAGINPTTDTSGPIGQWFKTLWNAMRTALEKLGLLNPSKLTAQDIVNLAHGAANVAMESETESGTQFSRADQVDSPAFRKWFGDSVVTDNGKPMSEGGEPLVVYHGTRADFSEFKPSKFDGGIYFSSSFGEAEEFARIAFNNGTDEGMRTLPVYLQMNNPAIVDVEGQLFDEDMSNLFRDAITKAKADGKDGLIIRNVDNLGGEVSDTYIAFSPNQVKSATGNNGNFDPSDARIQFSRAAANVAPVWDSPESSKLFGKFDADSLIYTLQDKHIDTKRVVEAIKKQSGDIADEFNPYLQEELFHGRSAKGVKDFLDSELRPLLTEMSLRKVGMGELEDYLHARHAEERNVQIAKINPKMPDGGSGMTTQEARDYLAQLDPARKAILDKLAAKIDAINANTRQLLVDSGLEKPETIKAWEGAYKHYVPLQREEVEQGGMGIGQGFSVKGSASKRAMGSTKNVADIIANIAMQRERAIVRAEKNKVAQATYGLSLKAPNPDFWITVNPAEAKAFTPKQQQTVIDELTSLGLDPADAMNFVKEPTERYVDPRTGLVSERISAVMRSAPNVLSMRVNGEDRYVFFSASDPRAQRMVHALKNLDADQLGRLLQTSAKLTRYFASINTQYNPVFGAINLTRDVQSALLNLSTTPLRGNEGKVLADTISALKGIYSDLRAIRKGGQASSQWAQLWEEFEKEGGKTGYRDMFANAADRAEAIQKELDQIGEGKLKAGGRAIFDWLSDYNESMENAVRLAAYKAAKDRGMSKQQAASLAKNLTVNFNRKGQITTQAGALYAFFNAAVQGTTRTLQTLNGPAGRKIILGGLTLGAMQAVMLAAAGFDDDEPPEFVRERSIIIPTGGGKYIAIPMPLGFHVIPNLSRITTEWALSGFKHTPQRISDLLGLFADTFNPIGNAGISMQTLAPTALDPLAALAENRDWTGKPIAREDFGMTQTPGYTRAKDTASVFSKTIAYWANLATGGTDYKPGLFSPSPDQLDYLIGQITGGVGREYLKAEQTAASLLTGEDLPAHKIPLLGRFYGDTTGQSSEANRFYSNLKEVGQHKLEIDGRRKDGGDVMEYMRDNPTARLSMVTSRFETTVRKLKQARRDAVERGDGQERIKALDAQITAVMRQFNDQFARLDQ